MKSIKDETDQLYGIIHKFENATTEAEQIAKEVLNSSFIHSAPNPTVTRLTVASETMGRRCNSSKLASTKQTTS